MILRRVVLEITHAFYLVDICLDIQDKARLKERSTNRFPNDGEDVVHLLHRRYRHDRLQASG